MDNEFNPDFYQKQLASLTINSRAVITDLTNIAERNVDKCNEICEMIEARIKKCLPQHKLNAMYLLDSICKNVGNPYNVIFGKNLFKTFTETYSIVTDTPTRQHLINLFKTWINAKTNTGSELFPQPVLNKIEKFIIQATSINGSTPPPSNGANAGPQRNRLAPDWLMKEGRSLLLFIIRLNQGAEYLLSCKEQITEEDKRGIVESDARRNTLVSMINETLDGIMFDMRGSDADSTPTMQFEANVKKYHANFQTVRKELEEQGIKQEEFNKKVQDKLHSVKVKQEQKQKRLSKRSKIKEFIAANRILLNAKPNMKYFTDITKDIKGDSEALEFITSWGKVPVAKKEKPILPKVEEPKLDLSSSLGMNLGSFNFQDSILSKDPTNTTESDGTTQEAPQETAETLPELSQQPTQDAFQEPKQLSIDDKEQIEADTESTEADTESTEANPASTEANPESTKETAEASTEPGSQDTEMPDGVPQNIPESPAAPEEDEDPYDPPMPPARSPSPVIQVGTLSSEQAPEDDEDDDYVPSLDGETVPSPVQPLPSMQGYVRTGTGVIHAKPNAYYHTGVPGAETRRPSILKRKASDGVRVVKRVRFDI